MRRFFFWMLFSSALGFLKVIALASLLAPADFGQYVSIYSAATLSCILLSFGLVEGTYKRYPRMWVAGDTTRILRDARSVTYKLTARFALVTVILAAAALAIDTPYRPRVFVFAGFIGLFAAGQALIASLLRATDSDTALSSFTRNRNTFSFVAACIGGLAFGWEGAIVGEAVGALASIVTARLGIRRAFAQGTTVAAPAAVVPTHEQEWASGAKLYMANLLSSSTSLADRGIVNAALGPAAAGAYGVVALLFQVGNLIVNILVQRFGPLVIKAEFAGDHSHGSPGRLRFQFGGLVAMSLVLALVVLGLKALDFPPGFFSKYSISSASLLIAGLVSMLQIYGLFEFHLLAHDQENTVLAASSAAAATFLALFGAAWWWGLSLEWFLVFVLVTRVVHVAVLSAGIWRRRRA